MGIGELIHPSLLQVRADLRRGLLHRARRTPLDVVELLGMAAALVGVLVAGERHSVLGAFAAVVAILLMLVRRTRRGLRQAMDGLRARGHRDPVETP